jgi:hypothetical protein
MLLYLYPQFYSSWSIFSVEHLVCSKTTVHFGISNLSDFINCVGMKHTVSIFYYELIMVLGVYILQVQKSINN